MAESNITKKALAQTLKKLMCKKRVSQISISEICDGCSLNRKSFYYHFKDKYDLVNWIFDTEIAEALSEDKTLPSERLSILCTYFYDNKAFYRKALSEVGQNSFSEHFHQKLFDLLKLRIQEAFPEDEITSYQVGFITDAVVAAFRRWLLSSDCMTAKEFQTQVLKCLQLAVRSKFAQEEVKKYL